MHVKFRPSVAIAAAAIALAGCSGDVGSFGAGATTASIDPPKVDPACVTLTSQIDGLKKDGVADKVAQAAAKKYKMTQADLAKADQLNKANAEFQLRCATLSPKPTTAAFAPGATAKPAAAAGLAANPVRTAADP